MTQFRILMMMKLQIFISQLLIVIADEFNISMNDAHLGIVEMKEEMDLIIDKPKEHELHTKH